jgi:hypothetical protein
LVYAQGLPVVEDWAKLYKAPEGGTKTHGDTGFVAKRLYGKTSVVVECGTNGSAKSKQVAYRQILQTLTHLGMVAGKKPDLDVALQSYKMREIIHYEEPGEFFYPTYNFAEMSKGMTIAKYESGKKIICPENSVIVLPKLKPWEAGILGYRAVNNGIQRRS